MSFNSLNKVKNSNQIQDDLTLQARITELEQENQKLSQENQRLTQENQKLNQTMEIIYQSAVKQEVEAERPQQTSPVVKSTFPGNHPRAFFTHANESTKKAASANTNSNAPASSNAEASDKKSRERKIF